MNYGVIKRSWGLNNSHRDTDKTKIWTQEHDKETVATKDAKGK